MPTPTQVLTLAPGAGYLAFNAIDKGQLFGRGKLNPILPQQIFGLYYIIKKIYDNDPNYTGMVAACNYLWEIMGRYGVAAQGASGGGSVSPITPPSSVYPLIFVVSVSSIIPDGGSSLVISSFIGYNLQFTRNGVVQSTINTESSYYTWDKTTGLFNCFPAAVATELFILMPV